MSHFPIPAQFPENSYPHQPPYHFAYPHPQTLAYSRPDELPRQSFFSYSPDVVKHRKRTSRAQRKVLEEAFRQNPKPSPYTRKLLIHQTGMERRAIQVWFQNRRAKEKKIAAKATVGALPSTSSNINDDCNDDSEDEDEDRNPTEGPCSPVALPQPEDTRILSTDPISDLTAPGAQDSSFTPAATIATTSAGSPQPSTNGTPSPPSFWRAHDSTRSLPIKSSLTPDDAYAMRRESAPAPLGGENFIRPSPFVHTPFHPSNESYPCVTVWEANTPPSPLSTTEDILSLRRGSLPILSTFGNMSDSSYRTARLQAVPSDPNIRPMSLERSKVRLASHPYASQGPAANGRFFNPQQDQQRIDEGRRSLPNMDSAPSPACIPTPAQITQTTQSSIANWDAISPTSQGSIGDNANNNESFPSYIRPRRHASLYNEMHGPSHRAYTEIVPGPLPAPNFSFGTASAPMMEADGNENVEDDEIGTATSFSVDAMNRFGSFASVASTASSVTSAWYSDVQSCGYTPGVDSEPATAWQMDARRASCPAPFVYAFSGLQMDNESHYSVDHQALPISTSSELALALDVSKHTTDSEKPAAILEDHVSESLESHMQPKLYSDNNMAIYPDSLHQQSNTFSSELGLHHAANYDMPHGLLPTDATNTTPTISHPFYR